MWTEHRHHLTYSLEPAPCMACAEGKNKRKEHTVVASYDCRGEDKTALTTPSPHPSPHPTPLPTATAHLTYTTGAELPYTHTLDYKNVAVGLRCVATYTSTHAPETKGWWRFVLPRRWANKHWLTRIQLWPWWGLTAKPKVRWLSFIKVQRYKLQAGRQRCAIQLQTMQRLHVS